MPTDTSVVHVLGRHHSVPRKGVRESSTVARLRSSRSVVRGPTFIPVVVPAGAIQAEDETYLLTEADDYIEVE